MCSMSRAPVPALPVSAATEVERGRGEEGRDHEDDSCRHHDDPRSRAFHS